MRQGHPTRAGRRPHPLPWGLSDHLLDLAECHIGLPVRYLGMEVKRELVQSAAGRNHEVVRRWHLDHEDRRILKVIVYLSDVDAGAGPFGYIHQAHSARDPRFARPRPAGRTGRQDARRGAASPVGPGHRTRG